MEAINRDLTGKRFGKRFIIERDFSVTASGDHYKTQCDCGRISTVSGVALRNGKRRQCKGCSKKQWQSQSIDYFY